MTWMSLQSLTVQRHIVLSCLMATHKHHLVATSIQFAYLQCLPLRKRSLCQEMLYIPTGWLSIVMCIICEPAVRSLSFEGMLKGNGYPGHPWLLGIIGRAWSPLHMCNQPWSSCSKFNGEVRVCAITQHVACFLFECRYGYYVHRATFEGLQKRTPGDRQGG